MAANGNSWILPLPRSFWKSVRHEHVSNRNYPLLVQGAEASWSKAAHELGTIQTYCEAMDTITHSPASIPECALLRQTPKIGARCGSAARRDLCGGAPERALSTATPEFLQPFFKTTLLCADFTRFFLNETRTGVTVFQLIMHFSSSFGQH